NVQADVERFGKRCLTGLRCKCTVSTNQSQPPRGAESRRPIMSAMEALAKRQDEDTAGFHQSWYPLALARELESGQVIGRDFLGTRVILYRDGTGKAVVQSAYCPHLGADLSVGEVVDGQIRCA